ncbi:phospholipase A1-Igamma1, chloroplastic-like [Triticum urartu]|uniref:Fungal lipase-type domain-containing protein n=1 Tax=Triticum urartu TaxID=4572 RepID=A0A8R7PZ52_TRIUA|nr:phospholipase A1-Igamma1, chloroplastic-like [Triticum urartu]
MAMSSNLARSLPDSPAGDLRPASLLSKMASRGRRPSQLVTSAVSADEAPANMSPGSVVGDMERGTLAEKTGRSDGQLTSRWRELHGSNDWQGLLDPIDTVLRGELIRYGEFAQACYDSFDYDRFSRYSGSCKYPTRTFFQDVGLAGVGYEVTRYLYATCHPSYPNFSIWKHNPGDDKLWSESATFVGFVAVSTDEETARIGRRDIAVAWRGTVTRLEWVSDLTAMLKPLTACGVPCPDPSVKVERGFVDLYIGKDPTCRFSSYSAREQVLAEVRKLVERYAARGEEVGVTVTGHSLGSALAMISAFDIAESGANVSPSAGGKKAPVCVFSFAGPRVGNTRFKERFEGELGVKALRIRNVHDMVPKVPGFLFNEVIFPAVLLRVADALRVPSVYTHVGVELALDHIVSPFLKPTGDLASYHNLEAHLHLLDGYRAHGQPFELGGRDPALVNKAADFLRDEHMVPPGWRQEENKGMVRTEDGRWALLQLPRDVEAHPVPDDIDIHLAALGLLVQEQDGI